FFTTKPPGVGTGLGLTICQRLINGVGGSISVDSQLGRGTTFRVRLPSAPEGEPGVGPAATPLPVAGRRGRVLVIDDEVMIGNAIGRALRGDHDVTSLTSASEALARIRGGERFDAIICDLMMPVMTGMEFHEGVRAE